MSARDRYSITLHCPTCGRDGTADLSENDHAYAPPETRVDAVSDGFRIVRADGTAATTIFACAQCGTISG